MIGAPMWSFGVFLVAVLVVIVLNENHPRG